MNALQKFRTPYGIALFSLGLSAIPVDGATITGVTVSGPGGSASSVVIATPVPGNDNSVGPSPNSMTTVFELSTMGVVPTSPGATYLDFTFSVMNSGSTTEYIVTDSFTNTSPLIAGGFHHILGFPVADADPIFGGEPFTVSSPTDGLDFDSPGFDPAPASGDFGVAPTGDVLSWVGILGAGGATTFTYSIDVPDFNPSIPNAAEVPGGYEFTIRRFSTIPEPSRAILLGFGVAGLLSVRRRRIGS